MRSIQKTANAFFILALAIFIPSLALAQSTITGSATGSLNNLTLTANVQVATSDIGSNGVIYVAANVAGAGNDSDLIFNYAEANYSQYLSPAGAVSQTFGIYYYRYYPGTNAYIATANGRFYYLGPASNNQILDLGASSDWLSTSLGLLAGSVNFTGPYSAIGSVSYTTTSNAQITVQAYPGQVVVHFNVTATSSGTSPAVISQRETNFASNGGTVIGKIPLIGFYLVQVPAGQENRFIQAMISGGYGVDLAVPNGAAVRGSSTPVYIDNSCWIGVGTCPVPNYVPLNVGAGIVVLDDFNIFQGESHGNDVLQTAVNAGGTVTTKVQLPVSIDGSVPNDKMVASVVAIQQGAAIFSPGQNVTTNLSFNAPADCEILNVSCGSDAWYPDDWKNLASMVDTAIKSVKDQLPESQKGRFLLVQEIGNANQDISSAYAATYNAEVASGTSGNHLYVGGSDGSYATQVNDPGYHNFVGWYPGCIAPGKCGSSYAAPAVAAFIDQVARQSNVTLEQAKAAVLQALIANPGAAPLQIVSAAVASLAPPTLTVTTAGTGGGTVTLNPPGPTYSSGTVVTVTASANTGSTFAGWSGACSGTGACVVTMHANKTVTATFNSTGSATTATYAGSFSGAGNFSRFFPGFTTCNFHETFSGTITLTITTQANGSYSGSLHVVGNWVSTATSGSTSNFTCLDTSIPWDDTHQISGTVLNINWVTTFVTPSGSNVTGNFAGTLSGSSITGTMVETIDTSTGSASIPITLTRQ